MHTDTAIEQAFKRAGIDTNAARLDALARELLGKNENKPERVISSFMRAIKKDDGLLLAVGISYLRNCAELVGGGRNEIAGNGQSFNATANQMNEDGAGLDDVANKAGGPMPASSSTKHDGGGRIINSSIQSAAAAPVMPVKGPVIVEDAFRDTATGRYIPGSIAAKFNPAPKGEPRGLDVMADVNTALMRNYKLPDGRAIGNLKWSELRAAATQYELMALVLRRLERHVQPGDVNMKVHELISVEQLKKAIEFAEGYFNAA